MKTKLRVAGFEIYKDTIVNKKTVDHVFKKFSDFSDKDLMDVINSVNEHKCHDQCFKTKHDRINKICKSKFPKNVVKETTVEIDEK